MALPNGTCATAQVVAIPSNTVTDIAGGEPDPASPCPTCAFDCDARFNAAWYTFTPAADMTIRIQTCGSEIVDTLLTLFAGTCGGLVEIACSEDDCGDEGYQSIISADVLQGVQYFVLVTDFEEDLTGSYTLDIAEGEPLPAPPVLSIPATDLADNNLWRRVRIDWATPPSPGLDFVLEWNDAEDFSGAGGNSSASADLQTIINTLSSSGAFDGTIRYYRGYFTDGDIDTDYSNVLKVTLGVGTVGSTYDTIPATVTSGTISNGAPVPNNSGYQLAASGPSWSAPLDDDTLPPGANVMAVSWQLCMVGNGVTHPGDHTPPQPAQWAPIVQPPTGDPLIRTNINSWAPIDDDPALADVLNAGCPVSIGSPYPVSDFGAFDYITREDFFGAFAGGWYGVYYGPDYLPPGGTIGTTEGDVSSFEYQVSWFTFGSWESIPEPQITNFEITDCESNEITITGTGFGDSEPEVTVVIDSVLISPVTVTSFSPTEVVVTVPSTIDGNVCVRVNGSDAVCADLSCNPVVTGLETECGEDQITISGTGLNTGGAPAVTLAVDSVPITPLTIISHSSTTIVVGLPSTFAAGNYCATVNGSEPFCDDLNCNGVVADITHECGTNRLVFTGEGFSTEDPVIALTFNGDPVEDFTVVSNTETEIVIELAAPFQDGNYCVTVDAVEPARCEDLTCAGPPTPGIVQNRVIRRVRQAPYISNENIRMVCNRFWLDCQVGIGTLEGLGRDPQIFLAFSDDNEKTWSPDVPMSMGQLGQYFTRVIWRKLGQFRSRIFRVTMTDPVDAVLLTAYLDLTKGLS